MNTTPMADTIVEITRPQRTLKPPLAETFAISAASLLNPKVPLVSRVAVSKLYNVYGGKVIKAVNQDREGF
jgi:ribosomal protein S19E (S16A)